MTWEISIHLLHLRYVSTDQFLGANALHSRWTRLTRFIETMHPNRAHPFTQTELNRARDAFQAGWDHYAGLINSTPNRRRPVIYWDMNANILIYTNALAPWLAITDLAAFQAT